MTLTNRQQQILGSLFTEEQISALKDALTFEYVPCPHNNSECTFRQIMTRRKSALSKMLESAEQINKLLEQL